MKRYLVNANGNKIIYRARDQYEALELFFDDHLLYGGPLEVICIGR